MRLKCSQPLAAIVMALAIAVLPCASFAQTTGAAVPAEGQTVVLDSVGFWRMFHELKPPVMATSDGLVLLADGASAINTPTAAAPDDWTGADFDDSQWVRRPLLGAIRSPYLSRLCLRGKFQIDDLSAVSQLTVSVRYHGGIILYVNGKEIERRNLPAKPPADGEWLAEPYAREAFLDAKGDLLLTNTLKQWRGSSKEEIVQHPAMKGREVSDLVIPRNVLRKGVNVLAIELRRAAYGQVVDEKKPPQTYSFHSPHDLAWNTCEILGARLQTASAQGLRPAATRQQGFEVWNSNLMAEDYDQDFGDPSESLRPVRLIAARNGAASGKVVVGSTQAIVGLQGRASDLQSSGGEKIAAAAVRVRYATAWGESSYTYPYMNEISPYPVAANPLGALQETPLEEYPVIIAKGDRSNVNLPGQPKYVPGAVVPVWVTVQVPADTAAGSYKGTLTINAKGQAAVNVPLQLEVVDWTVPDTQDRRTWVEMVQSPETLVKEYELEPWSDRHFNMISSSFKFIGDVGSRVLYIPLIAQSHFGNSDSMVRWIDKGNGEYEFDFSTMDKYLDAAEKHMGKPKIICLHVWDVYMIPTDKADRGAGDVRVFDHLQKSGKLVGSGPMVTVVDSATGAASIVSMPRYDEKGGVAQWSKLFTQLRERLKQRGIEKSMMLGTFPDQWATQEEVAALKDAAGDLPWVVQSHLGASSKTGIYNLAKCGYQSRVWTIQHASTLEKWSLHGWNRPELLAMFVRVGGFINFPKAAWRSYPEIAISGDQRGVARLGADFWNVLKNRAGRRIDTVTALNPQSSWRNLDPWAALLAPGIDGPVATTRYEMLREGLQECEARIVLEEALITPELKARLGSDLADRCESLLKQRLVTQLRSNSAFMLSPVFSGQAVYSRGIAGHAWFEGSPWQADSRELMTLAGEVEKKLKR